MYATELVSELHALIAAYGDFPVIDDYGRPVESPEVSTDGDSRVFLLGFGRGES